MGDRHIQVVVKIDDRDAREVLDRVFRERDEEIREAIEEIPRTTLSALLGLDLSQDTPTWDAIFQAVDDLWESRHG